MAYNGGKDSVGCKESAQTLVQMAQTVVGLDMTVIEALGSITSEEKPDIVIQHRYRFTLSPSSVVTEV